MQERVTVSRAGDGKEAPPGLTVPGPPSTVPIDASLTQRRHTLVCFEKGFLAKKKKNWLVLKKTISLEN